MLIKHDYVMSKHEEKQDLNNFMDYKRHNL